MSLDLKNALRTERRQTKGQSYTLYFFECRGCSAEISTQHSYAKRHSGLCRSCTHKRRPFESAFTQMKNNGRYPVELTYEEFFELCQEPFCHYCGSEIKRTQKRGEPGYRGYFLDRRDNGTGYTRENCVPCCWPCNQLKGDRFSYEQFRKVAALVGTFKTTPLTTPTRDEFLALNQLEE